MGYIDPDTGRYIPNPYLNPDINKHNRKHHHIKHFNNRVSLEQILMIFIGLLVLIGLIVIIVNIK